MTSHIPQPPWTLSGTVIEWPDGQLAPVKQGPWTATADGWIGVVSVPRGHEAGVAYHTAFITVVSNGISADLERKQALKLLALRLRSTGPSPPVHLGVITLPD